MKHLRIQRFAFVAFLSLGGGVASGTIPDASGVFHACYDNKSGTARIIDTATSSCTNKETAASWSMGRAGVSVPFGGSAARHFQREEPTLVQQVHALDWSVEK